MSNEFLRRIESASHRTSAAFAAAGVVGTHAPIDFGTHTGASGYASPERVELEVSYPAMTTLADNKRVSFTVQDSADGSTGWADLVSGFITGSGGVGVAAGAKRLRLPPEHKRWLRLTQTVEAAGGDLTAFSATAKYLF